MLCVGGYSSVFVSLLRLFTRILLRVLALRRWIEQRHATDNNNYNDADKDTDNDDVGDDNDDEVATAHSMTEAVEYLTRTVAPLFENWLSEAKSKSDLDSSVNFYSHLALLNHFTGNFSEFLYK